MSDRIRGGRPPTTPELQRPAEEQPAESSKAGPAPAATESKKEAPVDKFERGPNVSQQIETRLQALTSKTAVTKIQFSNEEIAQLANTFAAVLNHNRGANRLERARLFAKAILKQKHLKKVFAKIPEAQMEQMCDIIGDVLDSSPVFGQLVDNVTEGASKLNAG